MSDPDVGGLRALYINCTLKPSPTLSHTEGLMSASVVIMREHGAERDDWPEIYETVQAADILVIGTPIWLGDKSSVCTRVVERLYGNSAQLNETASTPTTARSAAWSSPATRTGQARRDERPLLPAAPRLHHLAKMLKDAGGVPAHGNRRSEWDRMAHPDHLNPEYR